MRQLLKFIWLSLSVAIVSACSIYEIDAPPPGPEEYWSRVGFTKPQIRSNLSMCGYDRIRSSDDIEKMEWCMLQKNFTFTDSQKLAHKVCVSNRTRAWNSPSCRSLRGEITIAQEESTSASSPEVGEKIQPKFNSSSISIAPSASHTVKLQEQVQKDNNTQMNQLLQAPGFRK